MIHSEKCNWPTKTVKADHNYYKRYTQRIAVPKNKFYNILLQSGEKILIEGKESLIFEGWWRFSVDYHVLVEYVDICIII